MFVNTVVHIIIITILTRSCACQACLRLSFIKCATLTGIYLCQTIKSSPDGKSSHMLLTLLYLKAVFRNYYFIFSQCVYVAVKIVPNYLNEATQTKLPTLVTYPSGLHYELCIAPRFYFGIFELSFRSVWDMMLCHWLNASEHFGGTSEL